jgi:hypothetical protein
MNTTLAPLRWILQVREYGGLSSNLRVRRNAHQKLSPLSLGPVRPPPQDPRVSLIEPRLSSTLDDLQCRTFSRFLMSGCEN